MWRLLYVVGWVCACAADMGTETMLECPESQRCQIKNPVYGNTKEFEVLVEEHTIYISYEYTSYMKVNCYGSPALDSKALPRFNDTLRVSRVTLTECPPPDTTTGGSFAHTLLALNVELVFSIDECNLTLYGLPAQPPLQAAHFSSLDDLIELQLIAYYNNEDKPMPITGFLTPLRSLRSFVSANIRLPPGELNNLPISLVSLSLREMGAERPTREIFALPNLVKLDLVENSLVEFPVPQTLRSLSLDSENTTFSIESIPETLEHLRLRKWSMPNLSQLTRCTSLRSLTLVSPGMKEFPNKWVAKCRELEILYIITAVDLVSLPSGWLENARHLQHLTLTEGVLETLPLGVLDGVSNLRTIDLSNNRLRALPNGMFLSTTRLLELDLSSNQLTAGAMVVLQSLYSLETLKLHNNSRLFDLCDQTLDRPGNSKLLNLKELRYLSLYNTMVTRICYDWRRSMPHLSKIDLRNTNISVIKSYDLQYNREGVEVLLDGAPVISVQYSEEDYHNPKAVGKVQLDKDSNLQCDCNMYWTRMAMFRPNGSTPMASLVTGLRCSNKIPLGSVQPDDMICTAKKECQDAQVPERCSCTKRDEVGGRTLLQVHCENAELDAVPKLVQRNNYDYDFFLTNNSITKLHIADLPANWTVLDLRHNFLTQVDEKVGRALVRPPRARRRLLLADNPLECNCSSAPFLLALHSAGDMVSDMSVAKCNTTAGQLLPLANAITDPCNETRTEYWLIGSVVFCVIIVPIIAWFTSPSCRYLLKIIGHRLGFVKPHPEPPTPTCGFYYDAYLCSSHKDENIVEDMVKKLERRTPPYRLCFHRRDWLPGPLISEQIEESMRLSRRTVVIVSKAYFESEWTRVEFREAYALGLRQFSSFLIVILLEDPKDLPLDERLQQYIKRNTYLRWGEKWFWKKLRLALGTPQPALTQSAPPIRFGPPSNSLMTPPIPLDNLTTVIPISTTANNLPIDRDTLPTSKATALVHPVATLKQTSDSILHELELTSKGCGSTVPHTDEQPPAQYTDTLLTSRVTTLVSPAATPNQTSDVSTIELSSESNGSTMAYTDELSPSRYAVFFS